MIDMETLLVILITALIFGDDIKTFTIDIIKE